MTMLLRPFRTLMFLGLSFLAGYTYARIQAAGNCADQGGTLRNGICIGASE